MLPLIRLGVTDTAVATAGLRACFELARETIHALIYRHIPDPTADARIELYNDELAILITPNHNVAECLIGSVDDAPWIHTDYDGYGDWIEPNYQSINDWYEL